MVSASSQSEAYERVCPYLHQLTADWLSSDADGFYCHGYRGQVKVLHSEDGPVTCALSDFASCREYQREENRLRGIGPEA